MVRLAGFIADDVIAGAVGGAEREPFCYLGASRFAHAVAQ